MICVCLFPLSVPKGMQSIFSKVSQVCQFCCQYQFLSTLLFSSTPLTVPVVMHTCTFSVHKSTFSCAHFNMYISCVGIFHCNFCWQKEEERLSASIYLPIQYVCVCWSAVVVSVALRSLSWSIILLFTSPYYFDIRLEPRAAVLFCAADKFSRKVHRYLSFTFLYFFIFLLCVYCPTGKYASQ